MSSASGAADVTLLGVAASGVLVLVAVAVSLWRRLGLETSILWASARMLVQLLVVGFALRLVVDPDDSLWWSAAWLLVMLTFAELRRVIGRLRSRTLRLNHVEKAMPA